MMMVGPRNNDKNILIKDSTTRFPIGENLVVSITETLKFGPPTGPFRHSQHQNSKINLVQPKLGAGVGDLNMTNPSVAKAKD